MLERPYATAIFAMSADGKISDVRRSGRKFGSKHDFRQLEECVAASDAVLMGAETLRSGGTAMRVLSDDLFQRRKTQGRSPQPRQFVLSRSGNLPQDLKFFSQPIPRWLVTTSEGAQVWHDRPGFDQVWICERRDLPPSPAFMRDELGKTVDLATVDLARMLQRLSRDGVETLAVLGGGTLVADLWALGAIDELHLTICPIAIGGATAPTPIDGQGLINLDQDHSSAPQLTLLAAHTINQEVFLRYRVHH